MIFRNIFKRLTTSILLVSFVTVQMLCFPLYIVHAATNSDGYSYSVSGGNATITGYTGAGGNISIPENIDGYSVTAIGPQAFEDCTNLTGVTIPNSVSKIGFCAFDSCTNLTNVNIPSSVTNIEDYAFEYCINLTEISIPNSVVTLGKYVFYRCYGLTNVNLSNSLTTLDSGVFMNCRSLPAVNIPNSVTNINIYAFANCASLTNINIGNSVTNIASYAFYNCSTLESVTIPSSVTNIEYNAFCDCIGLKRALFLGNPPAMGINVFVNCSTDFKVYYSFGNNQYTNPWNGYYTEHFYTVSYHGNGNTAGAAPSDSTPYINGEAVTVSENTGELTKTGYTFAGWNTASDGSGTNYSITAPGNQFTMGSTGNVALYAKWNPISGLIVNVTATDGTVTGNSADGYAYGNTVVLTANPNPGYKFVSWADESGNVLSTNKIYSFTITKNTNLVANFNDLSADILPSSSVSFLNLTRITDGDKNASAYSSSPYAGWIQLDLNSSYKINNIKLWHYFGDARRYHDVIIQVSNDPTFTTGVTTVFNNDTDNSSGIGTGNDSEYTESSSGLDVSFNAINARYARFYSSGNTINKCNHYVEIEIYGTPASSLNIALSKLPSSSVSFLNRSRITDGDKNTSLYSSSTFAGWVQIDLGSISSVGNIKLWHYFGDKRKYHDVIIQLSNDPTFTTGVTTVFNNDTDNSSGVGAGSDIEYTETGSGLDFSFETINARYARFYSNGNTINSYNHYVEIEIY